MSWASLSISGLITQRYGSCKAYVFTITKIIPKVYLNWRDVGVGGAVTALLFIVGKQLLALYMGHVNLGSAYGAAGSLIVVLIWVYYSTQVFFFGAEFTKVYMESFGSQRRDSIRSEEASGEKWVGGESRTSGITSA